MEDKSIYLEGSLYAKTKINKYTLDLINGINLTKRMKRDPEKLCKLLDKPLEYVKNNYGIDCEFYYNEDDFDNMGESYDFSIIDKNTPPSCQPSSWCHWMACESDNSIFWDGVDDFPYFIEWLRYLIKEIFEPQGIELNGEIIWDGYEFNDRGLIEVVNNSVKIKKPKTIYYTDEEDKLCSSLK